MTRPRFWVLEEPILKEMLEKAANGDPVDLILMEQYANSEVEQVEGEG